MKREKPMPWSVFIGSMLTMLSLFIAFFFNIALLGYSPLGREALQPVATILATMLLGLGLALVFWGLGRIESK